MKTLAEIAHALKCKGNTNAEIADTMGCHVKYVSHLLREAQKQDGSQIVLAAVETLTNKVEQLAQELEHAKENKQSGKAEAKALSKEAIAQAIYEVQKHFNCEDGC